MAKIVNNLKELNFLMSAFCIVFPDGNVLSIEKIRGFQCHIEYLKLLFKNDDRVKELLKEVDLHYYEENPSDLLNGIIPIFNENGCSVYMNLNPNVVKPTNFAIIFLPEIRTQGMNHSFLKMKKKFLPVCFWDGGLYNPETKEFDSFMPSNIDLETPNSDILYGIIENKQENEKEQSFHLG